MLEVDDVQTAFARAVRHVGELDAVEGDTFTLVDPDGNRVCVYCRR